MPMAYWPIERVKAESVERPAWMRKKVESPTASQVERGQLTAPQRCAERREGDDALIDEPQVVWMTHTPVAISVRRRSTPRKQSM